ncbi:MAG: AtpZ/AtpI family protein [Candidatus Latescibacterota bacterium]|nr:MAG: AtpZ/AtpI family protein [Candidatus Latescibacterota bacterium]
MANRRADAGGCSIAPDPRDFLRYSHLGIQFVIILIAFALGGAWLDRRLGAGNLVTLAAIFAGAAIGFYVMYREIPRK